MAGVGLDAKIPLYRDPIEGFYGLTRTVKQNTKQKLKMLMLTGPGERVMLPSYGVGLKRFLFENTPEFDIVQRIKEQVARYLPEVVINKINVTKKPRTSQLQDDNLNNTLFIELEYSIRGLNMDDVLRLVETVQGEGK